MHGDLQNTVAEKKLGALETKAHLEEPASSTALDAKVDEFLRTFEEFKSANDERIEELASKQADPLTEEKLKRIEVRLDTLDRNIKSQHRPYIGEDADGSHDERKAALEMYVRKGKTEGFDELESKGLSVGSEADGGYLAHPQLDTSLHAALKDDSPLRQIASVMTLSASMYKRPFVASGTGAGWVGETEERLQTASPQLAEISYPTMELYAMPAATKQLLDDSIVNIESWLVRELNDAFGEQETQAFIAGDGTSMPKGILSYPQQPVDAATFGSIGYVATGTAGDFDAVEPADSLFNLVHSLPSRYRRKGNFLMNRMTLSAVRRMKDANGDYLFQARLTDSLEMNLLGFPIIECDDMPDIESGSAAIAFGDFRRGYLIVDRQGTQILRDPYSAKPYVLFYATKRVGGGISDFNALRLLKFSTS